MEVPCPQCGVIFSAQAALADHAAEVHRIDVRPRPRRPRRASFGFLPLWFVLPLNLLLAVVLAMWLWPTNPRWGLYAGALSTLPLVVVLNHRQGR